MRITNRMMTNNMMNSINKNKFNMSKLEEQYSSGKKIQRPSDDPIVAVRALKLRTNLSELNQYYEKNIPDAMSWMDVTESALNNINDILTLMHTGCVQGTSDGLTVDNRNSIIQNLEQYKMQIYQEGNANYAGRYVFSGYKTDTSLTFNEATTDLNYTISEKLSNTQIESISKVTGEYQLKDYVPGDPTLGDFSKAPTLNNTRRIRLSYDKLSDSYVSAITKKEPDIADPTKFNDVPVINTGNMVTVTSKDPNAYKPASGKVNFIADTGELILSDDAYEALRQVDEFSISYDKKEFKEGDIRPEHYFDCRLGSTQYTKSNQEIKYEINFNQKLVINTQGSEAISPNIGRDIDEILNAALDVTMTEDKIKEVKSMLEAPDLTKDQKGSLNQLLEQFNTELVLKEKILHDKFANGIAGMEDHQDELNVAVADLGSRYVRLELTENRLSSQQVDFEDLLSSNEDVDIVDTYIKLSSAETIYNASLSAASKVVRNTLMDFL